MVLLASMLLHTELASLHYDPSFVPPLSRQPKMDSRELNRETMETLMAEMENMVIERNVMQDVGPMRAVWEAAVRRRNYSEVAPLRTMEEQKKNFGIRARTMSCFY